MDPLNQSNVPIPESPLSPQSALQTASPVPEMSQEQMRGNLQGMMSKIEGKYQDFNSQKFVSDNKMKEMKSEILREVFDLLQSKGIDPSNIEEVQAFLEKIKNSDPELSKRLESALKIIFEEGNEVMQEEGTEMPPEGGMPPQGMVSPEVPIGNMNMNNTSNESSQENL